MSGYAVAGKKTPKAKKLPVAPYLAKLNPKGDYYGGTFVASADPVKVRKKTPPAVDPDKGGLSASGFVAKTAATEDDPPEAADEAKPAAQQARHSVRGIAFAGKRLYVADQAKDRVGIYGHKSGTFHGWIDTTADTSAKPERARQTGRHRGEPGGRARLHRQPEERRDLRVRSEIREARAGRQQRDERHAGGRAATISRAWRSRPTARCCSAAASQQQLYTFERVVGRGGAVRRQAAGRAGVRAGQRGLTTARNPSRGTGGTRPQFGVRSCSRQRPAVAAHEPRCEQRHEDRGEVEARTAVRSGGPAPCGAYAYGCALCSARAPKRSGSNRSARRRSPLRGRGATPRPRRPSPRESRNRRRRTRAALCR